MLQKQKRARSDKYLAWIRSLPCLVCLKPGGHAHHEQAPGHGIMGGKVSDFRTLPLCPEHHAERHNKGRSFWAGADLEPILKRLQALYRAIQTTQGEQGK